MSLNFFIEVSEIDLYLNLLTVDSLFSSIQLNSICNRLLEVNLEISPSLNALKLRLNS